MNDEKKTYPAKINLVLRIVGGIYLAYLAWDLKDALFSHTGLQQVGFAAAILVFAGVGITLAVVSIRAYMRGEYKENMEE